MIIKNLDSLATTAPRRAALEIIEAGITRVLPSAIMQSAVSYDSNQKSLSVCGDVYPLPAGRLFVIGGGKASCLMAKSLESLIGDDRIADGLVICRDSPLKNGKLKMVRAGHPLPGLRGVDGVRRMLRLKEKYGIGKDDLVLCLISGGGSALMPCPVDGISLDDKQKITGLLLASGAEIREINAVRKHLSKIKGGRLGYFFSPATVISLILSDVTGNDLSTIASGPTVPDFSTFAGAYAVLEKYNLLSRAPAPVVEILSKGCRGLLEETPKVLDNCHNYIIGDNNLALQAMAQKAGETGYHPKIITAEQKGDTSTVALSRANEIIHAVYPCWDALLLGGETTLELPEVPGKGGRNQHYAAMSLLALSDYPQEWVMASAGTDGSDYLPGIAGAIIDNTSVRSLLKRDINLRDYIDRCDSNTLFKRLGNSLIETGNTGTNVGDVIVYLVK